MLRVMLITICGLAMAPALAGAQCPQFIENAADTGSAVFGLRWDDKRIEGGQGFIVSCRSNFEGASFELRLNEGAVTQGRRELTVGDDLTAALLDNNHNLVASVTQLIDFSDGTKLIYFDFSNLDTILNPGHYFVSLSTTADALCLITFDPAGSFADGNRIIRFDEDPWINFGDDLRFDVTLTPDENAVATESTTLGNVKSLYR